MQANPRNPLSDLRGASRLTIDAIIGTTDLTHYGPDYGFTPQGMGPKANAWANRPYQNGYKLA